MVRAKAFWLSLALGGLLGLLGVGTAAAATIGTPVAAPGGTTPVGNIAADGTIGFYIPLKGSATYGVNGGGMSATTCYSYCNGGTLTMNLTYAPVSPGANVVTLDFTDLDLAGGGANDPFGFFESMVFSYPNGQGTTVDNVDDAEVIAFDYSTQLVQILIPEATDPFNATLTLKTGKAPFSPALNTQEFLLTTVTPVPLPAALPLFLSGLAGLGLVRWRARRARAAA